MDALNNRNNTMKRNWTTSLIPALVMALFAASDNGFAAGPDEATQSHAEQISEWRQARHERLSSSSGWLTLVGLEWLQEGKNRIGSGDNNDIVLPGGPAYWGSVELNGETLMFYRADDPLVTVNGGHEQQVQMVADTEGEPTLVTAGSLSFYPIFRESYALRVKDAEATTLKSFTGVEQYDIDENWRIEGRFTTAEAGTTVEIANVLGQVEPSAVYGVFEFEREDREHRMLALGDENSSTLWFIFNDRTNGRETYGAGRFLYSDGMPQDDRLVVDFNKAYNPPCAFNDYSTCPLPPPENRLNLAVTAGEKDFHGAGH
jgi:uncharacterized protein (DUF1684 family)